MPWNSQTKQYRRESVGKVARSVATNPNMIKNVCFGAMILSLVTALMGDTAGMTIPYIGWIIDFILDVGATVIYGLCGTLLFFLSKRKNVTDFLGLVWCVIWFIEAVAENTLSGVASLIAPVVSKVPDVLLGFGLLFIAFYFAVELYKDD
ncbi:hypothetical protein [Methanococcus maripaludis]|uniref:Uncharacterized protein n=2 Tax=Methanococcus maripaludis TaxID=39152 RepID=A0A7J9PFU6_METMI|nr:hypothetical protein [Methanococcus maripaludis]MBA2861626.1 hypothetical protein [Methanococcus maripaludis]